MSSFGIASLRGSKKKLAKDLKVGNIILAAAKKAKVTDITKADVKSDLVGLGKQPITDTLFRVKYKFTEGQLGDTSLTFENTYLSGDNIVWFPEKKPQKYALKAVLVAGVVGMLTGMAIVVGSGLWVYFSGLPT